MRGSKALRTSAGLTREARRYTAAALSYWGGFT